MSILIRGRGGQNWARTCPVPLWRNASALNHARFGAFSVGRRGVKGHKSDNTLSGSLTYIFSDTFFIRETEATSVLFGSRLSKISIR